MNRPNRKWVLFAITLGLCAAGAIGPRAYGQSASSLFKSGATAEAKDDTEAAYNDYLKAFQKDPKDLRYKTAYERLRFSMATLHVKRGEKLRDQGDTTGAMTEFLRALEVDPSNELAEQDIEATRRSMDTPASRQETSIGPSVMDEMSEMSGPVKLKPISNEPLTLHMVEDSKVVYQTVGKAAGINVLFDPDYNGKRIQVDLSNVSLFRRPAYYRDDFGDVLASGDGEHDLRRAEYPRETGGAR